MNFIIKESENGECEKEMCSNHLRFGDGNITRGISGSHTSTMRDKKKKIILPITGSYQACSFLGHAACKILVPWPRIEPVAPAEEVQSPNHWTAREVPRQAFLNTLHEKDDGKKAGGRVVVGGLFSSEQSIPAALSRLKAMRTGLSAGTLAVLIMWAPEPWPSSGSSSCKDKTEPWSLYPTSSQEPFGN